MNWSATITSLQERTIRKKLILSVSGGQRRLRYLKEHRQALYTALLLSGKLDDHLANIDEQAETLLSGLVKQMAQRQGITEALKAADQMLWVQRMSNIRNVAQEVVLNELIYE
jgi:hypothetical protein